VRALCMMIDVQVQSIISSLALALLSACPHQTTPQPATPPPGNGDSSGELPPPSSSVPPADPGPCAAGGRLWDGKPEDCSYEHGGCCYESAAVACQAAGCAAADCDVLESYPAQIHCR
jgi:hypothetical protein